MLKTCKKLLVSIEFFVAVQYIIVYTDLSQQEVLLSAKEGDRLQTLDAILLLPFAKVFGEVVVESGYEG